MAKLQDKRNCSFFKGNIAHMTRARALRTLIVASAERLKSLSVHAKYTRTHCIRTIHVPNRFKNANVKPGTKGEGTTHRDWSQKFHTCLQRKIGSFRGGEFRND